MIPINCFCWYIVNHYSVQWSIGLQSRVDIAPFEVGFLDDFCSLLRLCSPSNHSLAKYIIAFNLGFSLEHGFVDYLLEVMCDIFGRG